ncbi:hypothetical protein RN001_008768 [Aquatica leii]|uniref:DUF4371 domain-containing protein n=1 Tax=Aquatica leii TaxID=1421715 RepID=A0AAN7SH22_9COLE|nr:hypothetical protein RN001_008768 [Aquatica leii]
MAHKTTDCAKVEQVAINLRYADLEYICLRKDFLRFIPVVSVTGESLRNEIKQFFNDMGLTLDNLRGQGYDGGSNMPGKFNGLQALISQEQPKAFYTHCFNH